MIKSTTDVDLIREWLSFAVKLTESCGKFRICPRKAEALKN